MKPEDTSAEQDGPAPVGKAPEEQTEQKVDNAVPDETEPEQSAPAQQAPMEQVEQKSDEPIPDEQSMQNIGSSYPEEEESIPSAAQSAPQYPNAMDRLQEPIEQQVDNDLSASGAAGQAYPARQEQENGGGYPSNRPQTDSSSLTCVEDGFFRHPDDCNAFYRCHAGTRFDFNCGDGLHFDERYSVCNWPAQAYPQCGQPTRSQSQGQGQEQGQGQALGQGQQYPQQPSSQQQPQYEPYQQQPSQGINYFQWNNVLINL